MRSPSLPAIYQGHLGSDVVSQEWGSEGGSGIHTQEVTHTQAKPSVFLAVVEMAERESGKEPVFLGRIWGSFYGATFLSHFACEPKVAPHPLLCFPKLAPNSPVNDCIGEGSCSLTVSRTPIPGTGIETERKAVMGPAWKWFNWGQHETLNVYFLSD